jgi:hypothetical protein
MLAQGSSPPSGCMQTGNWTLVLSVAISSVGSSPVALRLLVAIAFTVAPVALAFTTPVALPGSPVALALAPVTLPVATPVALAVPGALALAAPLTLTAPLALPGQTSQLQGLLSCSNECGGWSHRVIMQFKLLPQALLAPQEAGQCCRGKHLSERDRSTCSRSDLSRSVRLSRSRSLSFSRALSRSRSLRGEVASAMR